MRNNDRLETTLSSLYEDVLTDYSVSACQGDGYYTNLKSVKEVTGAQGIKIWKDIYIEEAYLILNDMLNQIKTNP